MNTFLEERLVVALEKIAAAFAGIDDTGKKQFAQQWPERQGRREAVYSRVPSEEDRIREEHGASDESLEDWLTVGEEGFVGPREREFLARQTPRPQTAAADGSGGGGTRTAEDQA